MSFMGGRRQDYSIYERWSPLNRKRCNVKKAARSPVASFDATGHANYFTDSVPRMVAQWPGKEQKNA
jgi:hypothetical protein